MEIHFKIIGTLLILLALLHITFPNYFKWKKELQGLSVINRQMMYVHSFFIALTVLLMGVLCVISADDLQQTQLGKTICTGLAIFWSIRFIFQFVVYSKDIWRGKKLETTLHIIASFFWLYLSIVFWVAALG